MKKFSTKLAAVALATLLLGAGCAKTPENTGTGVQANKPPQGAVVPVTFNPNALTPSAITIKVGDSIEFRNSDLKPHWPASNPHPSHTLYPEFDSKKELQPGETWVFKFEKVGTWGFHDHLNGRNEKFSGIVTVTQ